MIELGRIYVALPDLHLLLEEGRVRVSRGSRDHHFYPSIDVLFRGASEVYGPE
jgi:two-component system chemotaxis response regulator CheB